MRMKNFDRNVSNLRDVAAKYESDHNALVQYGCQNNEVLSGILDFVSDDTLEESVISLLADIDVCVEHQDIEACYRFGKAD